MQMIETIFPVFFMIALGFTSRVKGLITPEQNAGAKTIIFKLLFPFLIFNAIFTSELKADYALVILYVFVMFLIILLLRKVIGKLLDRDFSTVGPYMLATAEGGNVGLPLYIALMGVSYMINIVMFDIASALIVFMAIPIIVTREKAGNVSLKELLLTLVKNPFMIAVTLSIVGNLCGVYDLISKSDFAGLYSNTFAMITSPIAAIILFVIGYDLKVDMKTLPSLLKLTICRLVFCALIIGGFFLLFPGLMSVKAFKFAAILYFMCPTGFAVPLMVSPLCKGDKDSSFLSAFVSMYMVITLVVYVVLVALV